MPLALISKNIEKRFGTKEVLKDFSLSIPDGESFVLLGQSGSGKSVFMKMLLGLLEPTYGEIWVGGARIRIETIKERHVRMGSTGVVFQGSALFDSLKIWENVGFTLLHASPRKSFKAIREEVAHTLALAGLEERVMDLYPSSISGGMKRRVALARAIILKPTMLLLDEPTAGLDPVFSRLIADLINTCRKTLGATTLTITHDLHLAYTIADKIGMLHDKKLAWEGTVDEIHQTKIPLIREFCGT